MSKPFKILFFLFLFSHFHELRAQYDGAPEFKDITFNVQKLKEINFGNDTLNPKEILFTLYPGPSDSNYIFPENIDIVATWKCSTCKQHLYEDAYQEDSTIILDTLPFNLNYTFQTAQIDYTDKSGIQKSLISFSTANDYPPCGRYSYGLMSLAIFKKTDNWKLESFNPFVNFQGRFSTADAPDTVIIFPNKEIAILIGGLANPVPFEKYNPYYSNFYIFGLDSLKEILKIDDYVCGNNGPDIGSKWISSYHFINNENTLEVVTKGIYHKKYYWGMADLDALMKYKTKKLPRKYEFETKKIFCLENGNYVLKNQVISIKSKQFIFIKKNRVY